MYQVQLCFELCSDAAKIRIQRSETPQRLGGGGVILPDERFQDLAQLNYATINSAHHREFSFSSVLLLVS